MITKTLDLRTDDLFLKDFKDNINRWIQDGNPTLSYKGHFNYPLPDSLKNNISNIPVNIDGSWRYIQSFEGNGNEPYSVTLTEIVNMGKVHKITPIEINESQVKFSNNAYFTTTNISRFDISDIRSIDSISFSDFPEYTIWEEDDWNDGHGWHGAFQYDGRSYIRGDLGEHSYSPYIDLSEYSECEGRLRHYMNSYSMDNSDERSYLYVRYSDDSGWSHFATRDNNPYTYNQNFTGYFSEYARFMHSMSSRCQSGDHAYLYWIKITVQKNPFTKVLFSFDEQKSWVYHDTTSWVNCNLNDISQYGMSALYVENLDPIDYYGALGLNEKSNSLDIAVFMELPSRGAYPWNIMTLNGRELIELRTNRRKYKSISFYNERIVSNRIKKIY